jgi:hypothetical protein
VGVLIGTTTNLCNGLGGISTGRNLNQSSILPKATTRIVGTPHMVFTNPIMTTHVNMITYWPLMNTMAIGGYKNTNATNPRGIYWKPSVVTAQIPNHKDGHFIKPNKIVLKYLDLIKNLDLNVHVKVFNSIIKANVETLEEYIINGHTKIWKGFHQS